MSFVLSDIVIYELTAFRYFYIIDIWSCRPSFDCTRFPGWWYLDLLSLVQVTVLDLCFTVMHWHAHASQCITVHSNMLSLISVVFQKQSFNAVNWKHVGELQRPQFIVVVMARLEVVSHGYRLHVKFCWLLYWVYEVDGHSSVCGRVKYIFISWDVYFLC